MQNRRTSGISSGSVGFLKPILIPFWHRCPAGTTIVTHWSLTRLSGASVVQVFVQLGVVKELIETMEFTHKTVTYLLKVLSCNLLMLFHVSTNVSFLNSVVLWNQESGGDKTSLLH